MLDVRIDEVLLPGAADCTAIGIQGGCFVSFEAASEPARQTISGGGLQVFPGLIDEHVHFNQPGRTHWEGFHTGSLAAAAGGITSFFDMPLNSTPVTTTAQAFLEKQRHGEADSLIDFGLWGGLLPTNLNDLEPLAELGVIGFKAFFCDSGLEEFPAIDEASLLRGMEVIQSTGLRLALHAEHPQRLRPHDGSVRGFLDSRPVSAELDAVSTILDMAKATGCKVMIVHVSSRQSARLITQAKAEGVDAICETCPHYLLLNEEDMLQQGAVAKCAPPLRSETERLDLLEAWKAGEIDTLGSDHSPCERSMKEEVPFGEAWGGISGVQHGFPLLVGHGLDVGHVVESMSTRPAKVFGLSGKQGLHIDGDADFFLFDPVPGEVRAEELLYTHPMSPYVGMKTGGRVHSTYQRGTCIVREGRQEAAAGGKLLKPMVRT